MKKFISSILIFTLLLTGCTGKKSKEKYLFNSVTSDSTLIKQSSKVDSNSTLNLINDDIYSKSLKKIKGDYYINKIETQYVSKEYIEELNNNSQSNIYFGYSLSSLQKQFKDEKFIFNYNEDKNKTEVIKFEKYDTTFDEIVKNLSIGGGVILVCVTIASLGPSTAPITVVFAAAAKKAVEMSTAGAVFSAVIGGLSEGLKTKDLNKALKNAAKEGSDGFKWGAIFGALAGGTLATTKLYSATKNGLKASEVVRIQKDSGFSLETIKNFKSMDEYNIYKSAKCKEITLKNGEKMLIQNINLKYVDKKTGLSNLKLIKNGKAPIDPSTGEKYQLHHMIQDNKSMLAILTDSQHTKGGNNCILHKCGLKSSVEHGSDWTKRKSDIWKSLAEVIA